MPHSVAALQKSFLTVQKSPVGMTPAPSMTFDNTSQARPGHRDIVTRLQNH